MEDKQKEIENLIRSNVLAGVEIKLLDAKLEGYIISDKVFEVIKLERELYGK